MKEKILLGSRVKDPITGYEGVAVARHTYLTGCDRISVAAKVDKDGKLPDWVSFDETQLEIINSEFVPVEEINKEADKKTNRENGGPRPSPSNSKPDGRR